MEHPIDLCSLELGKEWTIPLAHGKQNSSQGYQHDILHHGSNWISSPEFKFPCIDGLWIAVLVKGEHCVYVKRDGSLQQTKLKYNSVNSGAWQVVLIHKYDSELDRETGVEPPVSTSMWDAQNRVLLSKTELDVNLCDYSYPRQVIRSHVFYSNLSLITFPLRFRINVTLQQVQPDDALEPWLQRRVKERELEEVNRQLVDLVLSPAAHDVVFEFKNQGKVYAHQAFLVQASPVFTDMFADTLNKGHEMQLVPVEDSTMEGFRHFLRCIYTKRVDQAILKDYVDELLYLSDKYNTVRLKNDCTDHLLQTPLKTDNCLDLYVTARKFGLEEMTSKVFTFMQAHAIELTRSEQWQDLTRKNQPFALELAVRMLQEQPNRVRTTSTVSSHGDKQELSCSEGTSHSD